MAQDPVQNTPPLAPPRRRERVRQSLTGWYDRTFDSMRNRNLRILWLGTFLNFAGVMMNMTAQSVVAFDLSGSNRAVGLVMLGQGLSLLVLSPFAGTIADRFSKRTTLIACQVVLGANFFLVGLAIATDVITIPLLAFSSFVAGTMFAMIRPLRNAYIGELAESDQRGNAVAVQQLAYEAGMPQDQLFWVPSMPTAVGSAAYGRRHRRRRVSLLHGVAPPVE